MNKLVTVLAVLAMLGVAGISMAGNVWIEIEDWGSPHPGLHSYLVRAWHRGQTASGEALRIHVIAGIALHDGPVHHVWANPAAGNNAMTPEIEDVWENPYFNREWASMDTCRLIPPGYGCGTRGGEWGFQPSETNDGSNPAGIDLTGPRGYEDFPGVAGVGEYGQPDTDAISFHYGLCHVERPAIDILQVVLLENTQTFLDIRMLTNDPAQWRQFRNIPIGVCIPWDLSGDGIVNDADAAILAAHWQYYDPSLLRWEHGEFNGDCKVTDADAAILATHWGEGCLEEAAERNGYFCNPDFDGDGIITDADAAVLATNWQKHGAACHHGDINGDEIVNDHDAAILVSYWCQGLTEGGTSTPEPSTLALLGMAVVGLLVFARRRRNGTL